MKIKKLLIVSLCIGLFISFNKETYQINAGSNEQLSPSQKYIDQITSENYYTEYEDITGLKGDSLLEGLASIMDQTHKYYTTYGDTRGAIAFSDEDKSNQSNIIDFYTGYSISNKWNNGNLWNREHLWCQSLSGGLYPSTDNSTRGAGGDIHHIRPEIKNINSSRGNKLYSDFNGGGPPHTYNGKETGNYTNSSCWEPRDEVKGDVARILAYLYTHYSEEVANANNTYKGDLKITNIVYTEEKTTQAAWALLIKWNEEDPVDQFEKDRNYYCASITGVRNPYIDHPEFMNMIFNPNYNGSGALTEDGGSQVSSFVNTTTMTSLSFNYSRATDETTTSQVSDQIQLENNQTHPFYSYNLSTYTNSDDTVRGLKFDDSESSLEYHFDQVPLDQINISIEGKWQGSTTANSSFYIIGLDKNNNEISSTKSQVITRNDSIPQTITINNHQDLTKLKMVFNKVIGANLEINQFQVNYDISTNGYRYYNFSNPTLKFKYNYDFTNEENIIESGIFITNNLNFDVSNSTQVNSLPTTNGNKVYQNKNFDNEFVVGLINIDQQSIKNNNTILAVSYILNDQGYLFNIPKIISVKSLLNIYSTMDSTYQESDGNIVKISLIASSYLNEIESY